MAQLSKGKRISGDLRSEVSASFVERYRGGESIRSIATESGRSYGFVQGLLKDSGVEFRSRGGARNRAQPTADAVSEPADEPAGIAPDDPSPPEEVKPKKAKKADKVEKAAKVEKADKVKRGKDDKEPKPKKDKKSKKDKKGKKNKKSK